MYTVTTYLYGNMRLAQQNTTTQYFLPDTLGSVRQLVEENGELTLTQAYQPYGESLTTDGSGTSHYGFTGEWTDATGLVHLRARYYAPGMGRFMTKDPWGGDAMQPMSFNPWLYVFSNPVNYTDPTGHYARDLHFRITLQLGQAIGRSYCRSGQACAYASQAAFLIARGNFHMDESGLDAHPLFGHPELHFVDQSVARRNAAAAVNLHEPYLLGAALHQVQDWYTHWNEGYRWPDTLGHAVDGVRAGCTGGPCHRSQDLINRFYEENPREDVEQTLAAYYSPADLNRISDDKLIDLFIQTVPNGIDLRQTYGYDTDHFFGFTDRDRKMKGETAFWLENFFQQFDPCVGPSFVAGYSPPENDKIVDFLNSGKYTP